MTRTSERLRMWSAMVSVHELTGARPSEPPAVTAAAGPAARAVRAAGRFEQLYRMGPGGPAWEVRPLVAADSHTDLDTLLGAVDPRVAGVVTAMTRLLRRRQRRLLAAADAVPNPTFVSGSDLGRRR